MGDGGSLRSGAVSAVLGEAATVPPIALRRLQLAAETGGATGLLLRPPGAALAHGGRHRAGGWPPYRPLPPRGPYPLSPEEGWGEGFRPRIRWRLELLRCRSVLPTGWLLDWCDETRRLCMAAEFRDDRLHRLRRNTTGAPPSEADAPSTALATVASGRGGLRIVAVDAAARTGGIQPGLPLADARALLPTLSASPADPAADRRASAELADWCGPLYAMDGDRSRGRPPGRNSALEPVCGST